MHKTVLTAIATLLFASVAMAQTPRIAHTSYRHYNNRVDEFHKQPMIQKTDYVMFGNSLIEYAGDWNERIPVMGHRIVNRGIIGDDAHGMEHRLRQIATGSPEKIFIDCGINDVSHKLDNATVAKRVQHLLSTVKAQCPESKIYYFSLLPINESFGRWKTLDGRTDDVPKINEKMRRWCSDNGVTYIDLYSHMTDGGSNVLRKEITRDGLHLNEQGYAIWVGAMKKYMLE